jgi:ELWxxDGT repeat protein
VGDRLFFLSSTQLWVSDGTVAGTVPLKTFYDYALATAAVDQQAHGNTGPSSGPPPMPPAGFTDVDGTLYFSANGGNGTRGLWKSDGTVAGTVFVKAAGPLPTNLVDVDGRLFFTIANEIWKSDGTPSGTQLVKSGFSQTVSQLVDVDGRLFFAVADYAATCDIWKSDGTAAGTLLVNRFTASDSRSYCVLSHLAERGAQLVFNFDTLIAGALLDSALWRSDGSTVGTTLVKDIALSTTPINLSGVLFFGADDTVHSIELWHSDGTAAGTALIQDINLTSADSDPTSLTELNGSLYFSADDSIHGRELWRSDGTAGGTTLVKDINPGQSGSYPLSLASLNGTLYFSADDGAHGRELWRSDGSAAGTVMVKNIVLGSDSSDPVRFTEAGASIYFIAGNGLWKTDGTAGGTVLVKGELGFPHSLVNVDGTLFFIAMGHSTYGGLWRSDGTPDSTVQIVSQLFVSWLCAVDDTLFFSGSDASHGSELWKSDGTITGTILLKESAPGGTDGFPRFLTNVGGVLFYQATDGGSAALWKSDGTAAGTVRLKSITPSYLSSPLRQFTDLNGMLAFAADDGTHGSELWRSDGTSGGTAMVKEINPGTSGANPGRLINLDGTLLFAATDASGAQGLWRSDGSARGTRLVQQVVFGPNEDDLFSVDPSPPSFVRAGATVFFRAWDAQAGYELWAMPAQPGIAMALQAPTLIGAPPGGVAQIALPYLNSGLTTPQGITLTATLGPGLAYIGQTSPVSPTLSGNTLTWRLAGVGYLDAGQVLLRVQAPAAPYGTRYPIDLRLAADSAAPSTTRIEVMIAHLAYMPAIRR